MRFLSRLLLVLICVLPALWPAVPAAAQADTVEAAALRAHLQNLRTQSYTFWVGGGLGDPANAPVRSPVGEQLTDWQLVGMGGDADVPPGSLERPTLFNFWASWCPPCQLEFPHLVSVALAPDDHAFDVLFVNMSDSEDNALAFLDEQPPGIHAVLDQDDTLARRLSVDGIPTSMLVDTDGTILISHMGIMTPTVTAFFDAVAAQPGVGSFDAADYADMQPAADLLPVDPASATPIEYGQRILGTLTDETFQQAYVFEGQTGDNVEVRLQADSSTLDAYVVLMTADGERLAENDDADDLSTDATVNVTLPADGQYIVVATRFLEAEGFASGDFSLSVNIPGGPTAGPAAGQGFLTYGQTVMGRVSGENPRELYSFEGRAGDVITLRVEHDPGGAALQIEVKDPHKDRLIVSEESVEGEAALVDLTLPEDGNYMVVVFRERSRDSVNLNYTLTLSAAGQDSATPPSEPGALSYGQTVSGTISDADFEDRWAFEGAAGDVISLAMQRVVDEPGGLDGFMQLVGPDGVLLIEADDTGDSVMPLISGYELPAGGLYTVVATRLDGQTGLSSGDYSLTLTRDDGLSSLPAGRPILYNERQIGVISAEDYDDYYTFRGRPGDVITIRMVADTGDLDPYLVLMNSNQDELASNDDAAADTQDAALLDVTLPANDTYVIRATRYGFGNGPSSGDYTLVIETDATPIGTGNAAPATLGYSQPVTGALSLDNVSDVYTFAGRAGDVITISVRRTGGTLDPALSLRGPDGTEIVLNRDWFGHEEARIARVELPQDGDYRLDVTLEDMNTAGDYSLILLAGAASVPPETPYTPAQKDLDIVLVWDSEADLDLIVTGPTGEVIGWQRPAGTESGQRLTSAYDACTEESPDPPTEQIAWESGTATPGLYEVRVVFQFDCAGQGDPVNFTLLVAINDQLVKVAGAVLMQEGDGYLIPIEFGP